MKKADPKKAKMHLEKLRKIISRNPPPIFRMSKAEAIKQLRKTRERIWEEKLALHH